MASNAAPIIIAGAGIAGLTAAIALAEAKFHVAIYERDLTPRVVGAGLQLGPSATRRLAHLGVDLSPVASALQAIILRRARTGHALSTIPLGATAERRFGAPYLTLLRADLHSALLSRAQELQIPIHFGAPLLSVAQDQPQLKWNHLSWDKLIDNKNLEQRRVSVKRDSALESKALFVKTGKGDLEASALIGADGVFSTVRELLWPKSGVAFSHSIAWRGVIPAENIPLEIQNNVIVWMGSNAHLVLYPVAQGQYYNAVLVVDASQQAEAFTPGAPRILEGWADLPLSIISASAEWVPWPIFLAPIASPSGFGRIQLIGDAWHAMTPHLASGAVLAIEDAQALADIFVRASPDVLTAFATFRRERGPRIRRAYFASARMGRIYQFPSPFDRIRDLIIAAIPGRVWLKSNDWLYGA